MSTAEKLEPEAGAEEEVDFNGASLSADIRELDEQFLKIFHDLCADMISNAGSATEYVLEIASKTYQGKASEALKDFKDLYFTSNQVRSMTEAVNKDVDDMFDAIKARVDAGEDVTDDNTNEGDAELKQHRLAISGLQKKLEMIISLDDSIKDRLMPVLTNMQFEDMSRQRLEHIYSGWFNILDALGRKFDDYQDVAEIIAEATTSVDERSQFYKEVLDKEIEEDHSKNDDLNSIFF